MKINGKPYTAEEAAAYIKMLLHILSACRPVLSMAFFADYLMQHKADALVFQIDTIMKGKKKVSAEYIKMLLRILSDCRPVLSMAFFADYHLQHKADSLMLQIYSIMKGEYNNVSN